MKIKLTMDRKSSSFSKCHAISLIVRQLGAKATVAGDVILVDENHDEARVMEILRGQKVDYSRSCA